MKKTILTVLILITIAGFTGGCDNEADPVKSAPAKNTQASEAILTLDEVLSGTWKIYAGYDQSGDFVYVSSGWANITFTFDADNGFSGTYRDEDGYIDASFKGTYDCSNSKLADKDPYKWYYYAKIDKDSIADSGKASLISRLGGDYGLNFIFKFREKDGEKLLFEDMQSLYFKR